MENKKTNYIFVIILIIGLASYSIMLNSCNKNKTFIDIMKDRYPKIYEEVMEEAEEIEKSKYEFQMRR